MAGYIRYANQGATRNLPLDDDLIKRLAYLEKMGITAEVFSGGQPGKDEGGARVGSVRHDHGGAGDMFFYKGDKKLDWNNPDDLPIFEEIVRNGKANGITGFGAGGGYMQPGSVHVGGGTPGVWGKGGKGDNAPAWLRNAYNGGSGGKIDPVAEVIAAANQPEPKPVTQPELQAVAMATDTPTTPKSNNGILLDAFNKITGKNVQVPQPPKSILGVETGKFTGAASGIGDFAKALTESTESTDNLNKQTQAAARGSGRSNTPVEISLMTSLGPERKRKKGHLGGLGGYYFS